MNDPKSHINLPEDVDVQDVLMRWCALSNIQRRALLGLAKEIQTSSDLVESSVSGLSDHFLKLATLAQNQSKRINDFADDATRVEFEGRHLSLSEVFSSIEDNLAAIVHRVIGLSKNSVHLSYTLEDIDEKLHSLYDDHKGDASVTERVQDLRNGVKLAKDDLKDIATVDISENFNLKDRLESLMSYLVLQSQNMEQALSTSAEDSKILSEYIADIVTKMQFQDRTSQRLSLICSSLKVVRETLKEMEVSSLSVIGSKQKEDQNTLWIDALISDMHLGEMRERFVKHLLFDETDNMYDDVTENEKMVDHVEPSDDIELF